MVNKRGREGRVQGRGVLRKKYFSSFTRCSRRSFLYLDGVLDDGRDGVMFLLALRRLRRYLFVYLSSKFSTSCFNAFRRALFALSVSMLFGFIFSYLENFFVVFSLSFYFILALRISARDTDVGSRWVHGSFPARPLANVVGVTVAGPQPAGVVEVPVLLEYLLSNPLQDLVATHPRLDGLQTDGLAAHVTPIKAPHRGLLAIARDGDEEGVPQGVLFDIPGHVLPCPSHHIRMILLGEHHLDRVVGLGPLGFLLGDSLDPCFRQHGQQASLLVTLISVLHVAAEEGVLPPEVPPIP